MTFNQYGAAAAAAATRYGIDPGVFTRQIQQESGFNPSITSPAGAVGIAQFMPATAAGMGVDPTDPLASLDAAARLMAQYLKQFNGSYALALAAYNAGPGAVQQYGGVPPYAETQQYVKTILGGPDTSNPAMQMYTGTSNESGKPVATPDQLNAAKQALAESLVPQTKGFGANAVPLTPDEHAAALKQILSSLTILADGTIKQSDGTAYKPSPTQDGGYVYIPDVPPTAASQISGESGLPPGIGRGPDGRLYKPGPDGMPVPATQDDLNKALDDETARAAKGAVAARAPYNPLINSKTGTLITFGSDNKPTDTNMPVAWPEEDPKITTQRGIDQFNQTLEQNRQIAEQQGMLTREQIQATRDDAASQARETRFATMAGLVPQMASLALQASKQAEDIYKSGSDVGYRLFSESGAPSPVKMVTPADQIGSLMTGVQQIQKMIADAEAAAGTPGAAGTGGTAQTPLPTSRVAAAAATPKTGGTGAGANGQLEVGQYPGGFTGEPGHDQQMANLLLKQGVDPGLVQQLWTQALLGAAPPAAGAHVAAAAAMPNAAQATSGGAPAFASVAPLAASMGASAPATAPVATAPSAVGGAGGQNPDENYQPQAPNSSWSGYAGGAGNNTPNPASMFEPIASAWKNLQQYNDPNANQIDWDAIMAGIGGAGPTAGSLWKGLGALSGSAGESALSKLGPIGANTIRSIGSGSNPFFQW